MRKLLALAAFLILPGWAFAQGVRVDNPGGPAQKIVQGFVSPIPGATITVCTSSATGTPCTPLVPTSPVTLCTDATCSTAAPNPFTADAGGNYGFWAVPGTYKVSITAAGVTGSLLTVTLPCAAGVSCVSTSGNNTFTGNNTHSGTETFTNLDDILWVGSGGYANVAAAVTAAGATNKTIIAIRSSYVGADCPVLQANLTWWDFRGNGLNCTNNVLGVNTDDTSVYSKYRYLNVINNPADSSTGVYAQTQYQGTFPANQAQESLTCENDIQGALGAPGSGAVANCLEAGIVVTSTGQTIANMHTILSGGHTQLGSTTNITNWSVIRAQALAKAGTGTITNVYGLLLDAQTIGTNNWSLFAQGNSKFVIGGGSGVLPATITNAAVMVDQVFVAGSGTARTYGVLGVVRQQADAAGDLAYGGFFKSNAQNQATGEIGIHSEVTDTAGVEAEFAQGGTVNLAISGSGKLCATSACATVAGLTLKKGSGGGNYTNATTAYAVADSTNLCFTVTIPTGWKLGVSMSGQLGTATAAVVANFALTDNAACSTANAGILVEGTVTGTAAAVLQPIALNWVITGDGAAHNIALQFKTSNGADSATLQNSSATLTPTMKFELMPSN